jgi:hypothetical protein
MLIDNVNLCSSSVLDRLNSLLETNGTLAINERGLINGEIKVIKPHPNFRLFMAMDPKHGEVSRAMRNRAIEICITQPILNRDSSIVDLQRLLTSMGLPGFQPSGKLLLLLKDEALNIPSLRLMIERIYRGESFENVFEAQIDNISGTTSWPDKLVGNDMILNSSYAELLCSSSFLYHQIMNENTFLSNEFPTPPNQYLKDAAAKRYFKSASIGSKIDKKAWLNFLKKHKYAEHDTLNISGRAYMEFPIDSDLVRMRNEILSQLSLTDYTNFLVSFVHKV